MYYLIYRRTLDVMKADMVLSGAGVSYEVVPVPKSISSECGLCIRVGDLQAALDALSHHRPLKIYNAELEELGDIP